jgi:hypothetical protein
MAQPPEKSSTVPSPSAQPKQPQKEQPPEEQQRDEDAPAPDSQPDPQTDGERVCDGAAAQWFSEREARIEQMRQDQAANPKHWRFQQQQQQQKPPEKDKGQPQKKSKQNKQQQEEAAASEKQGGEPVPIVADSEAQGLRDAVIIAAENGRKVDLSKRYGKRCLSLMVSLIACQHSPLCPLLVVVQS